MKTDPKPFVRVELHLSIEVEYDPFKGKTAEHFAQSLEDDIIDTVMDARPDILSLATSITEVNETTQY